MLFLQKNEKFLNAGGSAPRPPYLRRMGDLFPDPQPPAAGGFAPRPPLASHISPPPLRISGYAPVVSIKKCGSWTCVFDFFVVDGKV